MFVVKGLKSSVLKNRARIYDLNVAAYWHTVYSSWCHLSGQIVNVNARTFTVKDSNLRINLSRLLCDSYENLLTVFSAKQACFWK